MHYRLDSYDYRDPDSVKDLIADEFYTDVSELGSNCPVNWEETLAYLREKLQERVTDYIRGYGEISFDDICELNHELWEDYCAEKLDDCPAVFEE